MLNNKQHNASIVKQIAAQCGFDYCGIAQAKFLSQDAKRLEQWLHKGYNGSMQYMNNYFDLRTNPQLLVPGAKSVITLLCNYYPSQKQTTNAPKISKYAYSNDYHNTIKKWLFQFYNRLQESIGNFAARGFVDSAPVLERAWATQSGLGWIGKNGNLITKQQGSFFFIATLIVDIDLDYDPAYSKDFCGSCTKCIDACPTQAILPNKTINGSKCISYYTIELKDLLINEDMKGKFDNWMFGCDTCQDVCPWNRFSKPTNQPDFAAIPQILNFTTQQWEQLSQEAFNSIFKYSPLKRSKYSGVMRNLKFLQV